MSLKDIICSLLIYFLKGKLFIHQFPTECKSSNKDVISPGEVILKGKLCKLLITSYWMKLNSSEATMGGKLLGLTESTS